MDNAKPQESWNMATETLKRLSRGLNMCSYFSMNNDLISWYKATLDVRRNIYCFLNETEFDNITKKLKELPSEWIIKDNLVNPQHFKQVYGILDELYFMMVKHMKENGLLMPKSKDVNKAVIDM